MDRRYWVGFNLIKGIGAVRLQALRDHFGDLEMAWQVGGMNYVAIREEQALYKA